MELKFKCKQCGKDFMDDRGHYNRIFCSNKCKHIVLQSKEICDKISKSKLGHSVSKKAREKIGKAFKGKS